MGTILGGCKNDQNKPATLEQQKNALIGTPAPPDALKRYQAENPNFKINTPNQQSVPVPPSH